ncbi:hypothetical protein B7P34_14180 [Streptosporangium nondiastaticum]|uniref:Uncharacterized protein n=1 Tax=Streptosporangium nondiastaticum TaxID=35764 RepID=A0A9X7JR46_9ACTN|nr:hypothetical protein [Streptosporangium nondiastaticum]PSJ28141.1 hypothetical protein B7P34_14180 [Streptosporangium nondiastaticum]
MAKGDKAKSKAEQLKQQQAEKAGQTGKKAGQNANDKARQELIRKEQEEWDRRDTFDENFEI